MTEKELALALQKAAAAYLNRFAPSRHQFREMLIRKTRKLEIDLPNQAITEAIDNEIARRQTQGLINDVVYAEDCARRMQAAGKSIIQIKVKLHQKRIARDTINHTIESISSKQQQFAAAIRFAQKKRLGPYGDSVKNRQRHWKEMQKMVRSGHPFEVSKKVLNGRVDEMDLDEGP